MGPIVANVFFGHFEDDTWMTLMSLRDTGDRRASITQNVSRGVQFEESRALQIFEVVDNTQSNG